MIKRENLLKSIKALIEIEERLGPLLGKHIASSLFFSGLKTDEKDEILAFLKNRVITQNQHVAILKELEGDIKKSEINVY